jgi:uncharacterized protein (DUF1501 family)
MNFIQPEKHTRRAFLRRSGQLAFTGAALPMALNLAALGEAAAFNATDYKALVCVFLYGGSDYANTVVPYDNANYDLYRTIRGGNPDRTANGIALGQAALTPTLLSPTPPAAPAPNPLGSSQFALHPSMTGLANLFNTEKAAVQMNVGPLVVPVTRQQYRGNNRALYPLPPKLFSHNDQQSLWQSSSPEGSTIGWGGNIGDLAIANNSNANSLFTCISVTGNAVFLSGDSALSYQVGTGGPVQIRCIRDSNVYGSSAVKTALASLVQQQRGQFHVLENEYNRVTKRQIDSAIAVQTAIDAYPATNAPFAAFPSTNLGNQLKMVARLIAGRTNLTAKRQVFFVSAGGYDLHDNLISGQAANLKSLDDAMTAFYNATAHPTLNNAAQVTTFTASDFGRTLTSNGDGSDHGWGSHHFIMGGAVNGKKIYGTPPPVSVGNSSTLAEDQWHVGQGRLLPSTSTDQYAATLAKWFGVADNELDGVLPNLRNFGSAAYLKNLGFMKA